MGSVVFPDHATGNTTLSRSRFAASSMDGPPIVSAPFVRLTPSVTSPKCSKVILLKNLDRIRLRVRVEPPPGCPELWCGSQGQHSTKTIGKEPHSDPIYGIYVSLICRPSFLPLASLEEAVSDVNPRARFVCELASAELNAGNRSPFNHASSTRRSWYSCG